MKNVNALNQWLRNEYCGRGVRRIRHYQGPRRNQTWVTVDELPNTNIPGTMFAGYTDEIRNRIGIKEKP